MSTFSNFYSMLFLLYGNFHLFLISTLNSVWYECLVSNIFMYTNDGIGFYDYVIDFYNYVVVKYFYNYVVVISLI